MESTATLPQSLGLFLSVRPVPFGSVVSTEAPPSARLREGREGRGDVPGAHAQCVSGFSAPGRRRDHGPPAGGAVVRWFRPGNLLLHARPTAAAIAKASEAVCKSERTKSMRSTRAVVPEHWASGTGQFCTVALASPASSASSTSSCSQAERAFLKILQRGFTI